MAAPRSRKSSVNGTPISNSSSRMGKSANSSNEDESDIDVDDCSDDDEDDDLHHENDDAGADEHQHRIQHGSGSCVRQTDGPESPTSHVDLQPSQQRVRKTRLEGKRKSKHADKKKSEKKCKLSPPGIVLNTVDIDCFTRTLSQMNNDFISTMALLESPARANETCDTGSDQIVPGASEKPPSQSPSSPTQPVQSPPPQPPSATTTEPILNPSFLRDKLNFYESELKRLDSELERLTKEENHSLEMNIKLTKMYNEIREKWCES